MPRMAKYCRIRLILCLIGSTILLMTNKDDRFLIKGLRPSKRTLKTNRLSLQLKRRLVNLKISLRLDKSPLKQDRQQDLEALYPHKDTN